MWISRCFDLRIVCWYAIFMNLSHLEIIRKAIISKVFITKNKEYISTPRGDEESWIFDFRRVMLTPLVLDAYASLFMETHKDRYPFQVCGLEVAAIPLVSAIVMKSQQLGVPVNGFFIRKSRKKKGLLKMVEGEINDKPIILVDDILNSGSTFIRQVEILDELYRKGDIAAKVVSVSAILQYKNDDQYHYFHERNINVLKLFTLSNFVTDLPELLTLKNKKEIIPQNNFTITWSWKGENANYWYVDSKCQPLFFENRVYVGTDDGLFHCFAGDTGKTLFMYRVPLGSKKRKTFSSPIIQKDLVIFGAHDGNLYALDRITGKRKWVFMEGDCIDTTPCSTKHDTVVTGVTLGLFKKKSSLVSISITTGNKEWEHSFESSLRIFPSYHKKSDTVAVTAEDGSVYIINAKNGKCIWNIQTEFVFKTCPVFDEEGDAFVVIGMVISEDGSSTGHLLTWKAHSKETVVSYPVVDFSGYATPAIYKDLAIITSLDKTVRAYSLHDGIERWKTDLGSRIFSTPVVCYFPTFKKSFLYVGTNNGHLFEINPNDGVISGKTIVTERITDGVGFDPKNELVYLATYANELYALSRKTGE